MKIRNFILGAGIFVVYLLTLSYGIEAFYPSPNYEDYCEGGYYGHRPLKEIQCESSPALYSKEASCNSAGAIFRLEYNEEGCAVDGYCDECNLKFEEKDSEHSKIFFIISIIAGLFTLFIGYAFLATEPVGSSLLASGIGAIFMGSVGNWSYLGNIFRFLLLVISLIFLIWIALRLNKDKRKFKFWK